MIAIIVKSSKVALHALEFQILEGREKNNHFLPRDFSDPAACSEDKILTIIPATFY